jgi:hypothetical protein
MSLIDQTYFINDISLPVGEYSNVQDMIDRYEFDLLVSLFGYELAKNIIAYDPLTTTDQAIKDIVEGKEFSIDGRLIKWRGLVNDTLRSIIAYHVYYWWMRDNTSVTMSTGEIKPTVENGLMADLSQKIVNSSYRFFDEFEVLYLFMETNKIDYPTWYCDLSAIGCRLNTLDL